MSRRDRSMGYQGATSKRAKQTRRYPLRKVVDEHATREVAGSKITCWELECGHKVQPPSDIIGPRYPTRMRCRRCFEKTNDADILL